MLLRVEEEWVIAVREEKGGKITTLGMWGVCLGNSVVEGPGLAYLPARLWVFKSYDCRIEFEGTKCLQGLL